MAMATAIGPFHIPMISHFATCACLSDKSKYPSFLRTIPSDYYQSRALAQLVKHFGWTWVGAIRTNDDYGNNGMATFTETAQQLGICLEYSVSFFRTDPPDKILKIIDIIKASTSKVIIAFLSGMDLDVILHEFSHHNLTGYQWVGSEGWIFDSQIAAVDKHHILDGAIGLSIPKAHVSGMREFMLDNSQQAEEPVCTQRGDPEIPQMFKDGDIMLGGNLLFPQQLEEQTGFLHGQTTATAMHQISHFATCACLSDKSKYPSFLRTIPSDYYQSRALAQLVKHFGWTWVGAIRTNDDYGNNGMATFTETAQQLGLCLEYSVSFFRTDPPDKIQKIIDIIKASTSKVIIAFLSHMDLDVILHEFSHHNLTGYQWVGSEGWIFDSQTAVVDKHHILDGAIGLSIPEAHVSGMREFMLDEERPANGKAEEPVCTQRGDPEIPQMFKDGDIMLGGIFSFHSSWKNRRDSYTDKPLPLQCTSDKSKYPSFLRTIPSDYYQSRALAKLVKHFGWTWVGANRTNNDYGNNGMATFTETAQQLGICLEYSVSFFRTDPPDKIQKIIDIIKASTSKVIIAFLSHKDLDVIILTLSHHNLTGYQWIGSESWIFDSQIATVDKHHILDGAIGLSIPKAHVSGMREFMLDEERPANGKAEEPVCTQRGDPEIPQMFKDGDIMLGGIFSFHSSWKNRRDSYIDKPLPLQCTSDKSKYPSFLRTIPSDYYQSRALAQLVKHFGWTWVGAIRTNDDYGNNGMATFTETAEQLGICLEYSVSFFRTDPPDKIQKIIDIIKASTSKVIIAFLSHKDLNVILLRLSHHNLTGYQWVGSESWIFDSQTATVDKHHILDGAIGLSIPEAHVSGMREFMLDVRPLNVSSNEMFTAYYETVFSCKFKQSKSSSRNQKECTGREDLTEVQNSFTDMSLMPIFNNVYKGVYAAAHALHFILSCNKTCNTKVQLDPFTILQHIRTIQFKTKEGEEVYFNENGDPAAKYDIINWKPRENDIVEFVTVGLYDASLPENKQLHLQNESITWTQNSQQAEEPVCTQRGDPEIPRMFKDGDIMLGGIFSFHSSWKNRRDSYMDKPLPLQCTSLDFRGFQPAQVQAIMGETSSSPCMAIATAIGSFHIPMISHFATCACLSDKSKYPSFLRTIPSDYYQSRALAQLVKHFGWTWVGAIRTNDDYGNNGMATFTETAQQLGICLEYSVSFFRTDPPDKIQKIIDIIKASTSKVIIAFLSHKDLDVILLNLSHHNLTGYQWIGSESWIFDSQIATVDKRHILDGAIGLSIPEAHVSGMREFMLDAEEPVCTQRGDPEISQMFKDGDIMLGGIFSFHNSWKNRRDSYTDKPLPLQCTRPAQVQAIMGETSSSPCMAMATAIGPFHIPMISHFATCACLSDKSKYPSFLRTIPSDYYQSRALAQLVKHFGWTWVGAIRTNDDYGNNGMATFTETAQQLGICLEYSVSFFRTDSPDKILKIIDIIKASTSKVIIAFLSYMDLEVILHAFSHHNLTGYQWVGSESWIFDSQTAVVDKHHILDGAIGLSIPKAHVSGMREFMLDVRPLNVSSNEMFTTFYETLFSCKFKQSKSSSRNQKDCTGHEDLTAVQNSFTDMSLMPIFNNVYKGVYAAAHALHFILSCNKTCNTKVQLDPFTILQHIRTIQFKTKEGEEVYFNENGDPAA
ncbi:hypothetical protein JOQ06_017635, partial [Pogonophryne albipinna]